LTLHQSFASSPNFVIFENR